MTTKKLAECLNVILLATALGWQLPCFGQPAASPNGNKKTVKRYFDEVINSRNPTRLGEFFAQNYLWHQMNGKDVRSSEDSAHVSMLRFLFTAIPDLHYTIDGMVAEGDIVAVNATGGGTGKGEFFGLPAIQKKVHFKQMFFFRLANNKITEEWEVVDVAGLKEQLAKP